MFVKSDVWHAGVPLCKWIVVSPFFTLKMFFFISDNFYLVYYSDHLFRILNAATVRSPQVKLKNSPSWYLSMKARNRLFTFSSFSPFNFYKVQTLSYFRFRIFALLKIKRKSENATWPIHNNEQTYNWFWT